MKLKNSVRSSLHGLTRHVWHGTCVTGNEVTFFLLFKIFEDLFYSTTLDKL